MVWRPDYLTPQELADYERIPDDADDAQIGIAITTASRDIDRACNRQFGKTDTPVARYYTAFWHETTDRHPGRWPAARGRWMISIDDLMTADDLVLKFDVDDDGTYAGEVDHFQLKPINAQADGEPWTSIVVHPSSSVLPTTLVGGVEATATWGWTDVPVPIKQGTALQAARLLARRDSPYGIAGSPDAGSEMRLLAKLDPDVMTSVRPFLRGWWVA